MVQSAYKEVAWGFGGWPIEARLETQLHVSVAVAEKVF
jgi:hypothetical protein